MCRGEEDDDLSSCISLLFDDSCTCTCTCFSLSSFSTDGTEAEEEEDEVEVEMVSEDVVVFCKCLFGGCSRA